MDINYFSLKGKTILVTGASSGIGRSCAILASLMGANVILNGRSQERLQETMSQLANGEHSIIEGDLTKDETIQKIILETPILDGMILSAGIVFAKPFLYCSKDLFHKMFDLNFNSTVDLLRQIVKNKKLRRNSSVVVMSSIGSSKISTGNGMYSAAKGALEVMVRQCAYELANKGIRVNAIRPGLVYTPLWEKENIFSFNEGDEDMKKIIESYPLKRLGKPEDIAGTAVFLLSDASSWITGQGICVDGGLSIY